MKSSKRTIYTCECCGKKGYGASTISQHEKKCLGEKRVKDLTRLREKLIRSDFRDSIEEPSDVAKKSVEFIKRYNNFDVFILESDLTFYPMVSNRSTCPIDGQMFDDYYSSNSKAENKIEGYPGLNAYWIFAVEEETYESIDVDRLFGTEHYATYYPDKQGNYLTLHGVYTADGRNTWNSYMRKKTRPGIPEKFCYHFEYRMHFFIDDFPQLKGKWHTKMKLKDQA